MIFEDRLSAYPGRYILTNAAGDTSRVTLERADEPIREGTPLNAATFNSMQEEIQIASEDYPGCYYRMVGSEQEWINPPMVFGEVYRTAERHNGKVVYTCAVKFGPLSNDVEDNVALPVDYANIDVLDMTGWLSMSGRDRKILPYYFADTIGGERIYSCSAEFNSVDGLIIRHTTYMEEGEGAVTLKWFNK